MSIIHNLGFPRIGAQRELKIALEAYWQGEIKQAELLEVGRQLRQRHWQLQAEAGVELLPVGDFSWYDQVLDLSTLLGVIPERFGPPPGSVNLDSYFHMARGHAPGGEPVAACEMTKWFDTNYHYLVPEFNRGQRFAIHSSKLFDEVSEAQALGYQAKPVLLGPLSYLWLGKYRGEEFERLELLDDLLVCYGEILTRLQQQGVQWVQIDEPILALDLPANWLQAFEKAYTRLQVRGLNKLLAVYFGPLQDNLQRACTLAVEGLHVDAVRGAGEIDTLLSWLPSYKVLSLGVIDGRNIWRSDLDTLLAQLVPLKQRLGERLWLAPSCSLLHVPVDLEQEQHIPGEIRNWLAFATQKLQELSTLQQALEHGPEMVAEALAQNRAARLTRQTSPLIHNPEVQQRCEKSGVDLLERNSPFTERIIKQQQRFKLPLLPTTTIGSFPQTTAIRQVRRQYKNGEIQWEEYERLMQQAIKTAVERQERLGLDVLVHGEPERNDMVEYFGEQLVGFAFSEYGWVQSYGSRCVKPPILYGDVSRPQAMTVAWSRYAQSLSDKPLKGMLTGPVTLLNWSFVRDDQPRAQTCKQLALALRDEVCELEAAGIGMIQIDEAALREGLPLRKRDWQDYLDWAISAFRISASGVNDDTQIHTHMCYSEFNDILPAIADMDADVITIESSRSDMELLEAFNDFDYPNDIGPGIYDIHTPNVPDVESMVALLHKALEHIEVDRLWVNPDCGLKTRAWPEVEKALVNMVCAAIMVRSRFQQVHKEA